MLRLTATWDDQIRQFPLPAPGHEPLRLGAAPDNDLVLPAPGVSRRHAQLTTSGDGLILTDLESKNGLVRDYRRHGQVRLEPGGPGVLIGRTHVYLEEVSPADVEVALELDGSSAGYGLGSGSLSRMETAALQMEGRASSPRRALRLVREIESLDAETRRRRQSELLELGRQVLGAEALLVIERTEGRILLVEQAGRLPEPGILDELVAPLSPTGESSGVRTPEIGEIEAVSPEGSAWQVLASPAAAPGPELVAVLEHKPRQLGWRQELLHYLATRLFGPEPGASPLSLKASDETRIPSREPALALPDEMVVGASAAFRDLLEELGSAVRSDLDVLLTGETGSGKELIARALHASSRPQGPFVALNCAAIPGDLLEAELFGVEAGVATGVEPRPGRLVAADGGTLFLDEIGELDGKLQAKLLRVLQEREVLPLGARAPRTVDVRVVSATNRDLAAQVEAGSFRSDLYFRLRGLELRVPALRQRREDLPHLVLTFARRAASRYSKRVRGVSKAALSRLLDHDWPGNVRELKHAVERAVLRCSDGGVLDQRCFGELEGPKAEAPIETAPTSPDPPPAEDSTPTSEPAQADSIRPLKERVDELERQAIREALAVTSGNKTRAAELLGITRNGLNLKIKRLGIEPEPS